MKKEVHKQYLAQVKLAYEVKSNPERWFNAILFSGGRKMYAKNLDEAEAAIEAMRNRYPGDPDQMVVASRIRVREVTDWELVESDETLGFDMEG